jgi:hypothetical protein
MGGPGSDMGGGAMGGSSSDSYIRISGGTVYVDAEGDGIDSNGSLYIEGGTITIDGPTNTGNGALDSGDGDYTTEITGGTITAASAAGMSINFDDTSTQVSILYTFSETLDGGTEVTLTDEDGNVVLEATPTKDFQAILLSDEDITAGTYTITAGDETDTITVEDGEVSVTAGTTVENTMGRGGM